MNMCVKFRDNRLRNEICRAVTPFQYKCTYVRADPYIPCEGICVIITNITILTTNIIITINTANSNWESIMPKTLDS